MAWYRRRPVLVEAVQFTGDNFDDVAALGGEWEVYEADFADFVVVETLSGDLRAVAGDWVLRDETGELYPCKPDVFEAAYEPVPPRETP